MRKAYIIIFVLCLFIMVGCNNKPYNSKASYNAGYEDYLYALEQTIGDKYGDYHSCSKDGFIKAIKESADVIKEDMESGGDYSMVSIQQKDFDNLKITLELFEEDYDDYVDPDDFEADPLNPPDNEADYQLGVEHAKADLADFFEENGYYVIWSDARGWIMDHMYAMDSVDLNDCIGDFDFDNVDEDSWFSVDKIEHNHNLVENSK